MKTEKEKKKEKKPEDKYRRVLSILATEMKPVHTNGGYVTVTIRATLTRKDYETMMEA